MALLRYPLPDKRSGPPSASTGMCEESSGQVWIVEAQYRHQPEDYLLFWREAIEHPLSPLLQPVSRQTMRIMPSIQEHSNEHNMLSLYTSAFAGVIKLEEGRVFLRDRYFPGVTS